MACNAGAAAVLFPLPLPTDDDVEPTVAVDAPPLLLLLGAGAGRRPLPKSENDMLYYELLYDECMYCAVLLLSCVRYFVAMMLLRSGRRDLVRSFARLLCFWMGC